MACSKRLRIYIVYNYNVACSTLQYAACMQRYKSIQFSNNYKIGINIKIEYSWICLQLTHSGTDLIPYAITPWPTYAILNVSNSMINCK